MDAELFLAWMDAVGTLTREQRQKAFMTNSLREAEADDDLVAGDAVCRSAMAEALMVTATVLGDEMQSLSVAPWLPMRIGGKLDALTTAARSRVETRGCPHCDGKEVWPWGYAHGLPRYRCTECRRTFNVLSGTSLARLRHKRPLVSSSPSLNSRGEHCKSSQPMRCRLHQGFPMAPSFSCGARAG